MTSTGTLRPQQAISLAKRVLEIEARAITEALRRNNWRKMATARDLGINKTTLWRKIKRLNIKIP